MSKLKSTIAAVLSILLSFSLVMPTMAARVYNANTNTWEEAAVVSQRSHGRSAIPRERFSSTSIARCDSSSRRRSSSQRARRKKRLQAMKRLLGLHVVDIEDRRVVLWHEVRAQPHRARVRLEE